MSPFLTSKKPLVIHANWARLPFWRIVALLVFVGWVPIKSEPVATSASREFPIGSLNSLLDLPSSRLRSQLDQLPSASQFRALGWLKSFHFTAQDLPWMHVDPSGAIYYADPAATPSMTTATVLPAGITTTAANIPINPFPSNLVFHSRPGAPNILYLNFCGETVTNTQWNTTEGRTQFQAIPFDTDSDTTTFSDNEQRAIRNIWERVSEDYAPFNIDVTTERPSTFTSRTAHALITRHTDKDGNLNPASDSGGVGYVNVFATTSYSKYRPVWIYHDNLAQQESYIAEAASHEVGHNMGLSHDGTTSGTEYYGGHGSGETSWGPLMGTGYGRNVSQWSKGEYYQANNKQDDLATIAGKLTYRADDHGNTLPTATRLVVSDGTNILSTTPASDPSNIHPENKGILERNTDVDVFSFITGTGPVMLTVHPWIVPSATTRGGNLDVRLQLQDESGTLLLTVDPSEQTGAEIRTNLVQGRYFLSILNAGTGTPLNSSPDGYTAYGSIGQYFIEGSVAPNNGYIPPPLASLQVSDVRQAGQGANSLIVTYTDDIAVQVSSLDTQDVRITGPNGYDRPARQVSVNLQTDGTPCVVSYAAEPPDGVTWQKADNGTYVVQLLPGQVVNTQGASAEARLLGQFIVDVPIPLYSANMDSDPGWTLDPQWQFGRPVNLRSGPTTGFTGDTIIGYNLSGNYANLLSRKYATTPIINTAGSTKLTLHFRRWLRVRNNDPATVEVSTNGVSWSTLWGTTRAVSDTAWMDIQYPLPAGFAGSRSVQIRWGLGSNATSNEIGWNIDDVELLGDGQLDITPPTVELSVADLVVGGSPSHACSVTFTDALGVRLASLDSSDLLVTGPNGFTGTVEFVGADLPTDGSPCTATYSIQAPGGIWDASDNGEYELILAEDEVGDLANNLIPRTVLGHFKVNIPATRASIVVNPLSLQITEGSETSCTLRLSEAPANPVTISAKVIGGNMPITFISGATHEFSTANWSTPVEVRLRADWDEDATENMATVEFSAEGIEPVTIQITQIDAPPGELAVWTEEPWNSIGPLGGPFIPSELTYALTNKGGSPLQWKSQVSVTWMGLSSSAGTLLPGESTEVRAFLTTEVQSLPEGSYESKVEFSDLSTANLPLIRKILLTVKPTLLETVQLTTSVNNPEWGSVQPQSSLVPVGISLEVKAIPAPYFQFLGWAGDRISQDNPIQLLLQTPLTLRAEFGEITTLEHPTPHWWLASQGFTNEFEIAANTLGANGLLLWQSYEAGLDPQNAESQVRLGAELSSGNEGIILTWPTVSNRVYSLWGSTNALQDWEPLPDATNLPWTQTRYTNNNTMRALNWFQLRVSKP